MTRRRITVFAASGVAVAAAALNVYLWLRPRTKLTPVRCGSGGPTIATDFTVAERRSHTITIFRVDASGELKKLGTHEVRQAGDAYVVPGAGDWYGIRQTWQGPELRVCRAGKQEYAVPDSLLRWGARFAGPAAVLPDGRLLATYTYPPRGIEGPPEQESSITPTAILAREGNAFRRHPLVPDLTLDTFAVAISADGGVVAVSVAPHVKARDARNPKGIEPVSSPRGTPSQLPPSRASASSL